MCPLLTKSFVKLGGSNMEVHLVRHTHRSHLLWPWAKMLAWFSKSLPKLNNSLRLVTELRKEMSQNIDKLWVIFKILLSAESTFNNIRCIKKGMLYQPAGRQKKLEFIGGRLWFLLWIVTSGICVPFPRSSLYAIGPF